jgi:lipid II:glycine glycyltransferase (peptidoglycan interpeptide bridge formation enzyme)
MSSDSPFVPLEHSYTETQRLEFSLDLSHDTESLWRGIRKDQRERIRHLEREGVVVEMDATQEGVKELKAVREATQAKRDRQGLGYELSIDEAFYECLFEHLVQRGAARLFVAKHAGQVIAALFFATFNRRAYSVFSGSTDLGYRVGAQSGLFWTAVETFKAERFRELNRGGVPVSAARASDPLHGIYLFKLRLGTTPSVCHSGEKVLRPVRDRLVQLCKRVKKPRGADS